MTCNSCQLIAEIRYGSEVSFDAASMMDAALREQTQVLLAPLGPAYVDVHGTGDDFGFAAQVPMWADEDLRAVCSGLAALMDPQARGRLVAVPGGFGPVTVWRFTTDSLVEEILAQEG
ncbi:MAG: hypothetical protein ACLGSA_16285 [Acidobacteriota bacterium]